MQFFSKNVDIEIQDEDVTVFEYYFYKYYAGEIDFDMLCKSLDLSYPTVKKLIEAY